MSFKDAKDILSASDKDRLVCCFLNIIGTPTVNWEAAAADYGAASANAFRVGHYTVMKKINAGAAKRKADGEETLTETAAKPPKKAPRKTKKKTKKEADNDNEENQATKVNDDNGEDELPNSPGA